MPVKEKAKKKVGAKLPVRRQRNPSEAVSVPAAPFDRVLPWYEMDHLAGPDMSRSDDNAHWDVYEEAQFIRYWLAFNVLTDHPLLVIFQLAAPK